MRLKRVILYSLGAVVGCLVLYFIASGIWAWRWTSGMREQTMAGRRHILYEVDHSAILVASRELIQKVGTNAPIDLQRDSVLLAPVLRDITPAFVEVRTNQVHIPMAMGFDHFGIYGYLPGALPDQGFADSNWQLIPGLVYYDEGFHSGNKARWEDTLKKLRPNKVPHTIAGKPGSG